LHSILFLALFTFPWKNKALYCITTVFCQSPVNLLHNLLYCKFPLVSLSRKFNQSYFNLIRATMRYFMTAMFCFGACFAFVKNVNFILDSFLLSFVLPSTVSIFYFSLSCMLCFLVLRDLRTVMNRVSLVERKQHFVVNCQLLTRSERAQTVFLSLFSSLKLLKSFVLKA
jgi:hypothetical protein